MEVEGGWSIYLLFGAKPFDIDMLEAPLVLKEVCDFMLVQLAGCRKVLISHVPHVSETFAWVGFQASALGMW